MKTFDRIYNKAIEVIFVVGLIALTVISTAIILNQIGIINP